MSILSVLTGRTAEQDAEIDAALQDHRNAQQRKSELYTQVEHSHTRLSETKRQLGDVTYRGDTDACEKLQIAIGEIQADIARTEAAVEVADQKIAAANRRLHLANVQGVLRTTRRLVNKRAKHVDELVNAITSATRAFKKINETNELLASGWPSGTAPDGCLVYAPELQRAIQCEIARQDGVSPLSGTPQFPGSLRDLLAGDPNSFAPLADQIATANAHVLKLIEQGPPTPAAPAAESRPAKPLAPAAPFDPDDRLLGPPGKPGAVPTLSIADVAIPQHAPITIDHRSGK